MGEPESVSGIPSGVVDEGHPRDVLNILNTLSGGPFTVNSNDFTLFIFILPFESSSSVFSTPSIIFPPSNI